MTTQARDEVAVKPKGLVNRALIIGYSVAIGAALSYSVAQVLTRQNIQLLGSPIVGVVFTVFFGSLVLLLMNIKNLKLDWKTQRRGILYYTIAGIFANIGVTCLFFALQSAPVVVVSPVISINPLITLVLASLFLQRLERITPRLYAGAGLVVLGVIIIALNQAGLFKGLL